MDHTTHRFAVRFTGSGGEYFRIWIVNLLLLLLTLGLYYPWAKVRKLRYFHTHTDVGGHTFDFHGNPRQMLRGYLLVSALLLVYSQASSISATAGMIAAGILALLWPALLHASLRFRLAQTSWRGLRFAFKGSLKDAYLVFVVPGLIMLAAVAAYFGLVLPLDTSPHAPAPGALQILLMIVAIVAVVVVAVAAVPYLLWRLKAYQHNHYALGPWQTTFKATFKDVFKVFLKSSLWLTLGFVLLSGLTIWVILQGSRAINPSIVWLLGIGFWVLQTMYMAHIQAALQNLVWSQTGNRQIRFKSHVSPWQLARLMLKNTLLSVLTLGLYWPFAAVAVTRLKLQAVTVHTRQHPDELVAQGRQQYQDAAGDMAADLMGVEIGL